MEAAALQTTSERVDKDRVKLHVEVPEAALQPAVDAAYRRWAKEIKVPGFRKGHIPKQIIDARVGPGVVFEEAIRDALPDLYRAALQAEDLEAIDSPEINILDAGDGVPLVFEATVDVRPEIVLPDLASISVEAPNSTVESTDIDEQLERLRERFAELETAAREARRGDYVLIDLKGYSNDELVEERSAPDLMYEVGSRTGPPKLDEELEGERAGAILKFNDALPDDTELSFTVLLKEVKSKKLPPLDDEFAKTVGEFDTLEELKDDLRERLADAKKAMAEQELRSMVLERFVESAELEPPEKLVEHEFEHRLEHLEADLKSAGLTMDDYGRQAQLTELEIRRDIRTQAATSVKAELLLEEIVKTAEITIDDEDLGREIAYIAARNEMDPKTVAEQLSKSGRLRTVMADVLRRKALDHIVDNVQVSGRAETNEREELGT